MPAPVNYRYDEFLDILTPAALIESHVVPSEAPYYIKLAELPLRTLPSSCVVSGLGSPPIEYSWSQTVGADVFVTEQFGFVSGNTPLRAGTDGSNWKYRAFLWFDLSQIFPVFAPASTDYAELRVYTLGGAAASFNVHRLTQAFGAPSWGAQPTYDPTPIGSLSFGAAAGWASCNITSLYNAWQASAYPNYGVALLSEGGGTTLNFFGDFETSNKAQIALGEPGSSGEVEAEAGVEPAASQYAVHYGSGRVRFNEADAGSSVTINYLGIGSPIDAEDWRTSPPASSSSPGRKHQIAEDEGFFYICIDDDTWRRVAKAAF